METMIWAFGAMLILLLIISFLPLGLTIKGKVFVVVAGLVLALGGHAATVVVPFWQSAIIMLLLVLVIAYLLDSRLSAVMYQENEAMPGEMIQEHHDFQSSETQNGPDLDVVDFAAIQLSKPPLNKFREKLDHQMSEIKLENKAEINDKDILDELLDYDLPFLQGPSVNISKEEIEEVSKTETGYLSKIEQLMRDEPETLEELFLAMDEAAAGKETSKENNKAEKPIEPLKELY